MAIDPTRAIDRAGEGTPETFEGFFRGVYVRLAQALLILSGDRSEAEDLAQEALIRAYERWDRVRRMESPEGYVYRTAMNLNRKRLRRIAVRARRWRGTPARDELEAAETRVEAIRLLRSMSPAQREALVLVEWLGLSTEEAARVLGIDAATVRGRIHRARNVVRTRTWRDE